MRSYRSSLAAAMRGLILGLAFLLVLFARARASEPPQAPRNVCVNGGFEEVKPYLGEDHPVGWFVFNGMDPEIGFAPTSLQAHSGKRAGRLATERDNLIGMNQDLPGVVAGTARFWYRAIHSAVQGENLAFFMIPMRGENGMAGRGEIDPWGPGSGRIRYTVPAEVVGDGKWHRAVMDFDFQDLGAGHCVFTPRVNDLCPHRGAGEMLFDDVEILAAE